MAFVLEQKGELLYFRAENIKASHGFSTRRGGLSTLPHLHSLNLAFGRGDNDDTVRKNMELFCSAAGIENALIVSAKQIHSSDIKYVEPSEAGLEAFECDGFVTDKKGIALCVKVADCVPVLLCDAEKGVIAAVHAGWRGSASGICLNAVKKMVDLGADPHNINAAVGPSIHSCCFEVGEDYRSSLRESLGEKSKKYILERDGRLYSDLIAMNRDMLLSAGIKAENICESERCTCCDPDLFFSHRASKGHRGTMAAVICL